METVVQCAKCCHFLFTLQIVFAASYHDDNCVQFESGVLGFTTNWTEIKENNYINLTARLQDTSQCKTNSNNILQMKISYQQINRAVDLCKFILNTTCELSDSSDGTSNCKCLNNHTVQFLKKAISSDSKLYTWKWRQGKNLEKHLDIFISVTKGDSKIHTDSSTSFIIIIGGGAGGGFVLIIIIIIVVVKCRKSRDVNIQSIASIAAEKQAARKSDSSAGTGAGAAGNDSKSGGSSARSSSSGSDKPSSNPNYTSTALQEVEIHAYMDLHTRDPTYAATASKKDNHTYIELRTKRMQSEPPQPPAEGSRNSAIYANQGRSPKTPVVEEEEEDETNYYNTA